MGRHDMTFEETYDADVDTVWDVVSDVKQIPNWFPACRKAELVGSKKPGKGVKRVLHMDVRGKDVRSEQEITEWEPKKRFGWRHLDDTVDGEPFEMIEEAGLHFQLEDDGGRTKITAVAEWETKGFKAMLAAPLVKKVVANQTKDALANLKRLFEE